MTAEPAVSTGQMLAERERDGVTALVHVLGSGDISRLSDEQRVGHYLRLCKSLGLAELSRPFDWIWFKDSGQDEKLVLYPNQSAAAQLRRLHHLRIEITRREVVGELFVVEARASTPDGRYDVSSKYVPLTNRYGKLTGQYLANAMMKAECVPVESEILTRDGWRTYDRLAIGQEVLAYDLEADRCRWTPLQAVTVYDEALTVRVGTPTRLGFRCTPDHSWVAEHRPYRPDRRGGGMRGARGPYAQLRPLRELLDATRVSRMDRIILAAPAEDGDHPLTAHEAAILGWIMTDGNIRRRASHVRCTIYQSKPDRIEEIEQLVAASGYSPYRSLLRATTRDFSGVGRYGGGISECQPQRRWIFSAYESRSLLKKAGIESTTDLIGLVTRLSGEARAAMLAAMMAGDGDGRDRFGKKRKPGVMDAWEILATLEGRALGGLSAEDRAVRVRRMRTRRVVHGRNLVLTEPAVERVWCPTTAYGTWVMRQSDRIAITGNTGAKRRVTLSMIGLSLPPVAGEAISWRPAVIDGTGRIVEDPTEQDKALAADPTMARTIGEPVFEDLEIDEDNLTGQAPRPEEISPPKRDPAAPRPTFGMDERRALGAWFSIVRDTYLADDDARHAFVRAWTEARWPAAARTESLRTFFRRATEPQATEFLAHVRNLCEIERANAIEPIPEPIPEPLPEPIPEPKPEPVPVPGARPRPPLLAFQEANGEVAPCLAPDGPDPASAYTRAELFAFYDDWAGYMRKLDTGWTGEDVRRVADTALRRKVDELVSQARDLAAYLARADEDAEKERG